MTLKNVKNREFEQISKGVLENDKILKGFTNTIILNNFENTPYKLNISQDHQNNHTTFQKS